MLINYIENVHLLGLTHDNIRIVTGINICTKEITAKYHY